MPYADLSFVDVSSAVVRQVSPIMKKIVYLFILYFIKNELPFFIN